MSDPAAISSAGRAPAVSPWAALVVAVAAISWAGPLVRLASAPALSIAAWRLVFSMGLIAVVLAARGSVLGGVRLSRREWGLAVAGGVLLAGHFWSWIASLRFTSVASSVVIVSLQPFIVALLSAGLLGERPSRRQWVGILIAMTGAATVGWGDFSSGAAALLGDALSFLAAWLVAGYFLVGRVLRRRLDLWAYVAVVYGIAALVLIGGVALSPGSPMTGFPAGDWWVFLALAAGPMMIGHTGVNYAIRYVPAYVANLFILGEPIGATLIAWLLPAIAEVPPPQVLVGGAFILLGIVLGTGVGRVRARPRAGG
jgi:drug/metabolite transporter (DMT)-like permease